MLAMDFILFFFLGYCARDIFNYLKAVVNNEALNREFRNIIELDEEWHSDDLP